MVSPDVWGPGSESPTPEISPMCDTAVLSPSYRKTQQAIRDSGFVQLDHLIYSKDITYSNYYLFSKFEKNFLVVSAIQTMNDSSLW